MENMEQDYERNVQLDHYENQGIDDDKQEELSYNQRIAVEERLDHRNRFRICVEGGVLELFSTVMMRTWMRTR